VTGGRGNSRVIELVENAANVGASHTAGNHSTVIDAPPLAAFQRSAVAQRDLPLTERDDIRRAPIPSRLRVDKALARRTIIATWADCPSENGDQRPAPESYRFRTEKPEIAEQILGRASLSRAECRRFLHTKSDGRDHHMAESAAAA
jgi:hypothetical protein